MMKSQCDRTTHHGYRCSRRAVVKRGDLAYCRQHDPVGIKVKKLAKAARKDWLSRLSRSRGNVSRAEEEVAHVATLVAVG